MASAPGPDPGSSEGAPVVEDPRRTPGPAEFRAPSAVTPVVPLRLPHGSESPSLLDDEAVEGIKRGERWAWEVAYRTYAGPLTGFLYLRLRDREEVAEALSETFLRSLGRCASFRGDAGSLRAWFFRIARNVSTDRLRARQRMVFGGPEIDPPDLLAGDHSEALISNEEEGAVRRALSLLPPDDQEVLWLRICGRLSSSEVGDIVGKRPGAVRMQQQRALASLARHLEDDL